MSKTGADGKEQFLLKFDEIGRNNMLSSDVNSGGKITFFVDKTTIALRKAAIERVNASGIFHPPKIRIK